MNDYLTGEITDSRVGIFNIGMSFEEFLNVVCFKIILCRRGAEWNVWESNYNMFFNFCNNKLVLINVMNNYKGKYKGIVGIDDIVSNFSNMLDFVPTSTYIDTFGFLLKGNNSVLFVINDLYDIIPEDGRKTKMFDILNCDWYRGYEDEKVRGDRMQIVPLKRIEICDPSFGFSEFGPISI